MALPLTPGDDGLCSRSTIHIVSENGTEDGSERRSHDRLFACPYFKRNPHEHEDTQLCSKLAWTTIHGVRKHVYGFHILPIKCPSCSQTFNSSRMFTCHIHESPQCDRSHDETDDPMKGLETLLQKIKSGKIVAGDPLEEDKWKAIYTTLFPSDPKDAIPSPYYEKDQGTPNTISPYESDVASLGDGSLPCIREPEPCYSGSTRRKHHGIVYTASSSVAPSRAASIIGTSRAASFIAPSLREVPARSLASPGPTRPTSAVNVRNQDSNDEEVYREAYLGHSYNTSQSGTMADANGDEASNMHVTPETLEAHQQVPASKRRKLQKALRKKNVDAQVTAFQAWEKPHRTDEHITPGVYRGFWIWLARCFTFYIPSWFLKSAFKMVDFRQRLAFRQKVLFCLILASIYALVSYFLIVQPIASCVAKVNIGMISEYSTFCDLVRDVVYVYMGLGGGFMLLVAICVARVRYTDRSFEEHDALVVMQIPCYNEDEFTLRKTIDSCVQSSYKKKRKLLFVVADGTAAAPGEKPLYRTLLEDIFNHNEDLEIGIDNQAHSYMSFDSNGASKNLAFCCTGHYQGVPYLVVVKVGRDDEQDSPKPGNRGKRDSQLLAYNFFHYVNYRMFWSPLFENMEFKMRICLNIDPCDAMYMLAIDCDTAVDRTGISYLVDRLQKDPKLLGVCGYTGVGNAMSSFVASSQVFEYWLTHAVLKAVESICSSVLVLSGCFTIYRLKWANNKPAILHPLLLEDYAGSYDKTLHEHNLLSIGEDRYLSTLAIRYFGSDCRLRYLSAATCTTMVPEKLSVLLDQRRRWTNSLIHCHFAHLNVLPFEASFWTRARLLFILGAELFMVFILPLALPAGVVLAVISVLLTPYAWAILLAFLLLPVLLCILCMEWTYIPFYLPFFPMISVFSIIIPLFSIWNQDNIKWGKTRGG